MSQLDLTRPAETIQPDHPKAAPQTFLGLARQYYVPIGLTLILALAFGLRIYDITGNPNGLNQDEAVNGVDALSLGQTLRDHHGNFLPVLLQSFEDWASSLLTYLTVPFVWVLGLSEFSVRLPMVLLGTATVFIMYLYVRRLTNRPNLGLLAAFLLAVMPWHIMASRWAIPPNAVPFFLLVLLYVNARVGPAETKLWKFGLIGLCAVLAVYTYPTQKLFIPFLVGIFVGADFFNKIPFKLLVRKYLVLGGTFLVLTAPIYSLALIDPKYNARFVSVSIFTQYKDPFVEILVRYFNYFNPFIIFDGPSNFIFLVVFNYIGLFACLVKFFFGKSELKIINRREAAIILGWWLTFPIPASLTVDPYNPLRVIHGFPLTIIFSVVGLAIVGDFLKRGRRKKSPLAPAFYLVILSFSVYFLLIFLVVYFNQYKDISKGDFQYGIEQFSNYLIQHQADFDNVTVDSQINQPYIYYLFFSKENPHQYNYPEINFRKSGLDTLRGIPKLDNYIFARIPPETTANATEIYAVTDEVGKVWYRVYAKERQWYVVLQDDNGTNPPI